MNNFILPPLNVLATAATELAEQAQSRQEAAHEKAINKAAMQLHHGCSPIATAHGFLVESRTSPGIVYRVSNVHGCSCPAGVKGIPCWHAATLDIIIQANSRRVTFPAPLPTPRRYTAAQVGGLCISPQKGMIHDYGL